MSLASQVQGLATRIGTEFKTLRATLGLNSALNTTQKTTLVAAINEVKAVADAASGSGGASINDTTPTTSTAYSSSKVDTLLGGKADDNAVVKLTGAQTLAGTKTFSSAPSVPDGSFTISKTTGLQAAIDAKPSISDGVTNTTTVWSGSKTNSAISTAVAAVVNSAPAALDTLAELSTALGSDANFAATTATSLGNRVRVDTAAQGLNSTQKANALTNIGAADVTTVYTKTEVGDPTTDFVATFNAALV